jgi:membrane dipeptidase
VTAGELAPDCCAPSSLFSRRRFLGGAIFCAGVAAPGSAAAESGAAEARALLAGALTIDLHSHAGRVVGRTLAVDAPFTPVAAPMREGRMAVICLTMVADSPTTGLTPERRIVANRAPEPGELHAWGERSFARLDGLARAQGLSIVTDVATLSAAPTSGPSAIVAAEGADFLEGRLDRLDDAYHRHRLRHLQLTHYRVNELGDIQTAAPVHGGLSAFGAEVIRRCNRLGIVVDVAHGPYELVKQAATITTRPLVISHTSLARQPQAFSRLISPDHARIVAETGGVIGVWPPSSIFPDLAALAAGMARLVDAVGVDHVGLGTDMNGLTSPPTFRGYDQLPDLAQALLVQGFAAGEVRKLLGGNYARVFARTVG